MHQFQLLYAGNIRILSNQLKKTMVFYTLLGPMEFSWHDFIKQGVAHFILGTLSVCVYI